MITEYNNKNEAENIDTIRNNITRKLVKMDVYKNNNELVIREVARLLNQRIELMKT